MTGIREICTALLAREAQQYLRGGDREESVMIARRILAAHQSEIATAEGFLAMLDEAREQAIAASS